ncbi:MAG: YhcN/YlaJ family sporulation lipoprotein [Tissierellia bacterium]|nr:YhcN/YlaJ family sporulation lipoprotein [Tissierellia bacterium]
MKFKNKYIFLALVLVLSLVVACAPVDDTNDTGMNTRNRLTTQTRINRFDDRTGTNIRDDDMDIRFDTRLDNDLNSINNDTLNRDRLNNGMVRNNNNSVNYGNMASRANEIAQKISDLPEVERASVVITDDTALVGCELRGNRQGTMTNALRQKIRGIVKEHARDIDNISITTDPDFTDRIRTMSDRIFQGNPIEEFADDIEDLIRRITPGNNVNNNIVR